MSREKKLVLVAILGSFACAFAACRATTYGEELDACVATASTLEQSQACRCDVNKRYGRVCRPDPNVEDAGDE